MNATPIRCFERARSKALDLMQCPAAPGPGYLHGNTPSTLLHAKHVSTASYVLMLAVLNAGLPVLVKDLTAVAGVRFTEARLWAKIVQAQQVLPAESQKCTFRMLVCLSVLLPCILAYAEVP